MQQKKMCFLYFFLLLIRLNEFAFLAAGQGFPIHLLLNRCAFSEISKFQLKFQKQPTILTSKLQDIINCATKSFAKCAILIGCSSTINNCLTFIPKSGWNSHVGSKCLNSHALIIYYLLFNFFCNPHKRKTIK